MSIKRTFFAGALVAGLWPAQIAQGPSSIWMLGVIAEDQNPNREPRPVFYNNATAMRKELSFGTAANMSAERFPTTYGTSGSATAAGGYSGGSTTSVGGAGLRIKNDPATGEPCFDASPEITRPNYVTTTVGHNYRVCSQQ